MYQSLYYLSAHSYASHNNSCITSVLTSWNYPPYLCSVHCCINDTYTSKVGKYPTTTRGMNKHPRHLSSFIFQIMLSLWKIANCWLKEHIFTLTYELVKSLSILKHGVSLVIVICLPSKNRYLSKLISSHENAWWLSIFSSLNNSLFPYF